MQNLLFCHKIIENVSCSCSRNTETTIAHYYVLELILPDPHMRCEISHTQNPPARIPCDLSALKSLTPILSCHQSISFVRLCVTPSQAFPLITYFVLITSRSLGQHSCLLQHVVVIMAVSSSKIQHPREFCICYEYLKGDVTQLTCQHMFCSECLKDFTGVYKTLPRENEQF